MTKGSKVEKVTHDAVRLTAERPAEPVYQVPAEVAIALSTGRTEFLTIMEKELREGKRKPLTVEAQAELIRLLKGMVADARRYKVLSDKRGDKLRELRVESAAVRNSFRLLDMMVIDAANGVGAAEVDV